MDPDSAELPSDLDAPAPTVVDPHAVAATDAAVQALYERYPYPPPLDSLDALLTGADVPLWNPRDSSASFFPEGRPARPLDVLVAGCGTRMAPIYAALLPDARVVGIDIARPSLDAAARLARSHGLANLELVELPLERVGELARAFDVVHCFGVLHHLADPTGGLRALADVTRPSGVLSIMVYARHGRVGVYLLQALARLLGLRPEPADVAALQGLVRQLPIGHPLSLLPLGDRPELCAEEVVDMLLHPRDVAFDVAGVRALVDGAGLALHRWLGQAQYDPAFSPLGELGLGSRVAALDPWQRAAAMESFHGRLWQHACLLTHPSRPTAAELFDGDGILDAFPVRSPHGVWWEDRGDAVLSSVALLVPLDVRLPLPVAVDMLEACDGHHTASAIAHELELRHEQPFAWHLAKLRALYAVEAIELTRAPDGAARPRTRKAASPRPRPAVYPTPTSGHY